MIPPIPIGIAILTDDIAAHDVSPSKDRLTAWHEFTRAESYARASSEADMLSTNQSTAARKMKGKFVVSPEVANAKRLEREAKRAAKTLSVHRETSEDASSEDPTQATFEDASLFAPGDDSRRQESRPIPQIEALPSSSPAPTTTIRTTNHFVTIPATSSSLPWYPMSDKSSSFAKASPVTASLLSHSHEHSTLESARDAGLWTYPATLEERARCAVFRDLHEKGYWMGGGLRFGGDWLVYPGQHSYFDSEEVFACLNIPDCDR